LSEDTIIAAALILLNRQSILDHWNEYADGVEHIRALKSLA
jgi:hypothetical protein